jgi:hypothetical protein
LKILQILDIKKLKRKKRNKKENLGCWHLEILLSKLGNRGEKWGRVRGGGFWGIFPSITELG